MPEGCVTYRATYRRRSCTLRWGTGWRDSSFRFRCDRGCRLGTWPDAPTSPPPRNRFLRQSGQKNLSHFRKTKMYWKVGPWWWWWSSGQRTCLLSDDPSSNAADAYSFSIKFVLEKNENKHKTGRGMPIFKALKGHCKLVTARANPLKTIAILEKQISIERWL